MAQNTLNALKKKNLASSNDDAILKLSTRLCKSYRELGDINQMDGINLPSHTSIKKISDDIISVLFPGFICDNKPNTKNLSLWTIVKTNAIFELLCPEIMNSVKFANPDICSDDCYEKAATLTLKFMNTFPELRKLLASDVQAAYDGDPASGSREEIILCYPGVYAISLFRVAHELFTLKIPLIPRMITEYAHRQTGIDIHPGATIGKSCFIDHGTGVVIGATTEIGDNVKIYQNVTLGALSFKKNKNGQLIKGTKRHPTLGDNVIIYSGSSLLGGKTHIGNNSVVGGNLWITSSIPENTTVIFETASQQYKVISADKK